eukprot:scaffold1307_cov166-Ochromonas_danica.AAC.5
MGYSFRQEEKEHFIFRPIRPTSLRWVKTVSNGVAVKVLEWFSTFASHVADCRQWLTKSSTHSHYVEYRALQSTIQHLITRFEAEVTNFDVHLSSSSSDTAKSLILTRQMEIRNGLSLLAFYKRFQPWMETFHMATDLIYSLPSKRPTNELDENNTPQEEEVMTNSKSDTRTYWKHCFASYLFTERLEELVTQLRFINPGESFFPAPSSSSACKDEKHVDLTQQYSSFARQDNHVIKPLQLSLSFLGSQSERLFVDFLQQVYLSFLRQTGHALCDGLLRYGQPFDNNWKSLSIWTMASRSEHSALSALLLEGLSSLDDHRICLELKEEIGSGAFGDSLVVKDVVNGGTASLSKVLFSMTSFWTDDEMTGNCKNSRLKPLQREQPYYELSLILQEQMQQNPHPIWKKEDMLTFWISSLQDLINSDSKHSDVLHSKDWLVSKDVWHVVLQGVELYRDMSNVFEKSDSVIDGNKKEVARSGKLCVPFHRLVEAVLKHPIQEHFTLLRERAWSLLHQRYALKSHIHSLWQTLLLCDPEVLQSLRQVVLTVLDDAAESTPSSSAISVASKCLLHASLLRELAASLQSRFRHCLPLQGLRLVSIQSLYHSNPFTVSSTDQVLKFFEFYPQLSLEFHYDYPLGPLLVSVLNRWKSCSPMLAQLLTLQWSSNQWWRELVSSGPLYMSSNNYHTKLANESLEEEIAALRQTKRACVHGIMQCQQLANALVGVHLLHVHHKLGQRLHSRYEHFEHDRRNLALLQRELLLVSQQMEVFLQSTAESVMTVLKRSSLAYEEVWKAFRMERGGQMTSSVVTAYRVAEIYWSETLESAHVVLKKLEEQVVKDREDNLAFTLDELWPVNQFLSNDIKRF